MRYVLAETVARGVEALAGISGALKRFVFFFKPREELVKLLIVRAVCVVSQLEENEGYAVVSSTVMALAGIPPRAASYAGYPPHHRRCLAPMLVAIVPESSVRG